MADSDKEKFKYTLNSKKYPSIYAFETTKSSAVAGHDGEPGTGTGQEFFVFEGKEGYNRIESVKWPNHFVYESSEGYAYIRNDGANMQDDALFLMTSLGDNTMTISSKKWPENRMCYIPERTPRVVFCQSEDESSLWILDSKTITMKLPDANDQRRSDVSSSQTRSGQSYKYPSFGESQRGPATQTASSASPKQECTELNSHRRDEKLYIKYEPAGRHIADAALLGVQSHAQCVIAKWPFNQCVHSKKKQKCSPMNTTARKFGLTTKVMWKTLADGSPTSMCKQGGRPWLRH